ncbi:MAG TPA: hypothetical protein K8V21_07620 [Weissella thailandensis]|uniref:hypothetical protein n=1 Tax=Weissella thailandensis TaxID=89061 RepID=UPI001D351868|nr:hypothetical protein [Weissella thailandensis]HJG85234.1 hypothetical protein [Weissella thailandensis]
MAIQHELQELINNQIDRWDERNFTEHTRNLALVTAVVIQDEVMPHSPLQIDIKTLADVIRFNDEPVGTDIERLKQLVYGRKV